MKALLVAIEVGTILGLWPPSLRLTSSPYGEARVSAEPGPETAAPMSLGLPYDHSRTIRGIPAHRRRL